MKMLRLRLVLCLKRSALYQWLMMLMSSKNFMMSQQRKKVKKLNLLLNSLMALKMLFILKKVKKYSRIVYPQSHHIQLLFKVKVMFVMSRLRNPLKICRHVVKTLFQTSVKVPKRTFLMVKCLLVRLTMTNSRI